MIFPRLLAFASLLTLCASAHADSVFSVVLSLQYGGSVSGTVSLDQALTKFTGGSVTSSFGSQSSFDYVLKYGQSNVAGADFIEGEFAGGSDIGGLNLNEYLYLYVVTPTPLVATTSLTLCTSENACGDSQSFFEILADYDVTGTIAVASVEPVTGGSIVAQTPEPSSIALLGTGMLGVAGVVRKRFAA